MLRALEGRWSGLWGAKGNDDLELANRRQKAGSDHSLVRPGESAICPVRAQPSAEIVRVECESAIFEITTQPSAEIVCVEGAKCRYGTKRDALELLPSWAVCSPDFQEAFGRLDAHCVEREAAAKRVWKDLVGHGGFSIQRWLPDESQSDPHTEAWRGTPPSWALSVLQPVISALPQLKDFELRLQQPVREDANEIWLGAVPTDLSRPKELRVQRSPPLVEVYNILEHGRHFYRTMVFSSDTAWSFHVPSSGQRLLRNAGASVWSVAAGDVVVGAGTCTSSVIVLHDSQMHLPRRFLRGILPDALLQPYRFWRCCGPLPGGAGQIEGEEVAPRDEATRLRIQLTKMGSAKVERLKIEAGDAA
ncbi:unnamed protein product [Durusdinium trenchii]|uniref:Uncharacterized protein n=1 Tax=Durusdinium trenchii TaxID=1381693 RepID=A0ABP0SYJ5_9DINO